MIFKTAKVYNKLLSTTPTPPNTFSKGMVDRRSIVKWPLKYLSLITLGKISSLPVRGFMKVVLKFIIKSRAKQASIA